ncbi:hypothetical protein D3C87_1709790 [compost metagenome]
MLDAEAHRALQCAGIGDRACRLMPLVLQRFRVIQEPQAGSRRHRPALVAGEELAVELRLQRLDAMGNGGLGDVQPFGRAVEGACLHQVQERLDQIHLHRHCVRFRRFLQSNRIHRSIKPVSIA